MVKKKDQARTVQIMRSLEKMTAPRPSSAHAEDEVLDFDSLGNQPVKMVADSAKSLRMKKFRTQLFYQWLVSVFEPCRVADVGGGKGLLSFLLANDGWQTAVIDPFDQTLPDKYKDLSSGQRVKIGADQASGASRPNSRSRWPRILTFWWECMPTDVMRKSSMPP